ncbi:MAG TPA: hypothetical protein VF846_18195, partial [Thermoanaerobaculia bacterium]
MRRDLSAELDNRPIYAYLAVMPSLMFGGIMAKLVAAKSVQSVRLAMSVVVLAVLLAASSYGDTAPPEPPSLLLPAPAAAAT